MKKNLKVCHKWQGKKSVPSINLQGNYLTEYNFNVEDTVRVEFYRDEIRIKRITPEMILKTMSDQNPAIKKLIAEFDCQVCDW